MVTGEPVTVKSDAGAVTPTLVIVARAEHAQEEPFHTSACLEAQVLVSDTFRLPLVPPPVSPLPLAVVTPVIVPGPVPGNVCPVAKVKTPLLLTLSPVSAGVVAPNP